MRVLRVASGALVLTLALVVAAAEEAPAPPAPKPLEIGTFQLVLIVPNPEFEEEEGVRDEMAQHRYDRTRTAGNLYLRNLVNDRAALIAGPLSGHERIEEVAVLDVETRAEAESIFAHSPSIETQRMELEVYTWHAPKNVLTRPKDPDIKRTAILGFLERPSDAPSYPQEKLDALQAGHLAHLRQLTEAGDLVLDGPVDGGGELRELLIFRAKDPDHVAGLMADDPLIEAGRLVLEAYAWEVPRDCLPYIPRKAAQAAAAQENEAQSNEAP